MALIQQSFRRKTRNYYEAPPAIRELFDLGVAERYWYTHPKEFQFCTVRYDDEYDGKNYKATPQYQKQAMKKLLNAADPIGVVAIGSQPTCDMALALMSYMIKAYHRRKLPIYVHNMASGTRYLSEHIAERTIVFLYNINTDDDPRRVQDVRDIIFETQGHLRVIVFAGDNPLRFMCERVRFYPNSYFYLMGKYRRIVETVR